MARVAATDARVPARATLVTNLAARSICAARLRIIGVVRFDRAPSALVFALLLLESLCLSALRFDLGIRARHLSFARTLIGSELLGSTTRGLLSLLLLVRAFGCELGQAALLLRVFLRPTRS